jgi:O-antigen/teichoic acid export membrane protein
MASVGTSGAKVNTMSSILSFMVLIALDVILIPLIGISGAALTLIFAYLAPAVFLYSKRGLLTGIG